MRSLLSTVSGLLLLAGSNSAIKIDLSSPQSIKNAAKTIATDIISIYDGKSSTGIPGLFPKPYYWWESGLAWDSLINYWSLTGDDTYNDRVTEGLLWQVGPDKDYMPPNQTTTEGNDDQSTWALACMTAAERGFPDPPSSSGVKSWVQLAQNVFESQAARWDTKTCGGGLRWQYLTFNNGYDYKNTLSNGNFMQLGARLAQYTGNQTYSQWASKVSQWTFNVGLIDNSSFAVYDGTSVTQNCKHPSKIQWTSSLGTYLSADAYLYNFTSITQWSNDTSALFQHANRVFVENGVLTEATCVGQSSCSTDEFAFRAILARALYNANSGALTDSITPLLQSSATGAAAQCSGGKDGTTCGSDWASSKWDGTQGLGQDLSALEIILATLPSKSAQTENGTSTTGGAATNTAASTTSGGASPTNTNGASGHHSGMPAIGILSLFAFALAFC